MKFPLTLDPQEEKLAGLGLHCLYLDSSSLSSDSVHNKPFYTKHALLRRFQSDTDFLHLGAQDDNPHLFVSTSKAPLLAKIKTFFADLVERSQGPQLDRVRYRLSDTHMIHRDQLLVLLGKFGEVRHLALHNSNRNKNCVSSQFARTATTVLLLPHGKRLPEKFSFKIGPMTGYFTTKVHDNQDVKKPARKKKIRKPSHPNPPAFSISEHKRPEPQPIPEVEADPQPRVEPVVPAHPEVKANSPPRVTKENKQKERTVFHSRSNSFAALASVDEEPADPHYCDACDNSPCACLDGDNDAGAAATGHPSVPTAHATPSRERAVSSKVGTVVAASASPDGSSPPASLTQVPSPAHSPRKLTPAPTSPSTPSAEDSMYKADYDEIEDDDDGFSTPSTLSPGTSPAASPSRYTVLVGPASRVVFGNKRRMSQRSPSSSNASPVPRRHRVHVSRHGSPNPHAGKAATPSTSQ